MIPSLRAPFALSAAVITLCSTGQSGTLLPLHQQPETPAEVVASHSPTSDYRGGGGVVWSEDFSGGWPAGWTVQDSSGICPWVYSMDGSWGFFNGNSGTAAGTAIASTTAADGFIIADNDSANNAAYGQPSSTQYQYLSTHFTTSVIDLTGHPYVNLEFEQYFRYNNAPTLDVSVSTDGLNWTTWDVKGSTVPNAASPNVDLVGINISAVAGDQPTVYIKIGWDSRVYFWMIDDMRIVDSPANDLRLNGVDFSEWFFDTAPDFGTLEYTIYPATQLRPFTFKGEFTNEGYLTQTGVELQVIVTDGGGLQEHVDTGTLGSVDPLSGDSIYTAPWNPVGDEDDYTVTFDVSSDSIDADVTDNQMVKTYSVSPYLFGRDRGTAGTNGYNNGADPYELGNWFNIINSGDYCYAINVAIDDATPVGVLIQGVLRDVNRDIIDVTEEYTVSASDLNAAGDSIFITLPFSNPIELILGDYLALVQHFGGADDLFTAVSGVSVPQTSLLLDYSDMTWYYVTAAPMVRMNLDPLAGITEHGTGPIDLGCFPNPADLSATINCTLDVPADVQLELRDVTGKLVASQREGSKGAGTHSFTIDTATLSEGLYTCTLTAGGLRSSIHVVVAH